MKGALGLPLHILLHDSSTCPGSLGEERKGHLYLVENKCQAHFPPNLEAVTCSVTGAAQSLVICPGLPLLLYCFPPPIPKKNTGSTKCQQREMRCVHFLASYCNSSSSSYDTNNICNPRDLLSNKYPLSQQVTSLLALRCNQL